MTISNTFQFEGNTSIAGLIDVSAYSLTAVNGAVGLLNNNTTPDRANVVLVERSGGARTAVTGLPGRIVSDTSTEDVNTVESCRLTDDLVLVAYADENAAADDDFILRVVDTSDGSLGTQNVWADESTLSPLPDGQQFYLVPLSSTKAVIMYRDVLNLDILGHVVTISGTTISSVANPTAGTELFDDMFGPWDWCPLDDSTFVIIGVNGSNETRAVVVSVSGTTLTPGSSALIDSTFNGRLVACSMDATSGFLFTNNRTGATTDINGWNWSVSGTTFTPGSRTVYGSVTADALFGCVRFSSNSVILAYHDTVASSDIEFDEINTSIANVDNVSLGTGGGEYGVNTSGPIFHALMYMADGDVIFRGTYDGPVTLEEVFMLTIVGPVASSDYGPAAMSKPADVGGAGEYIYIAALSGGAPVLLKLSTDLNANATQVFAPGSGSDIGVECGRQDSQVVWVGGGFDGTNTVEVSDDGGGSFTVADDGSFNPVTAFEVGPGVDDDRVMVVDNAADAYETFDGGGSWFARGSALITDEVKSLRRLPVNPDEVLIGGEQAATDLVNYSPNALVSVSDISGILPPFDVKTLVFE